MSKSMTLTCTTFGMTKRPMSHAARKPRCGTRGTNERGERQHERDAEIGEVEEGDGARAVGDRRRRPPADEPQPSRPGGLERRRDDERGGQQVRGQERQRVPWSVRSSSRPPATTQASASSGTTGKRKKWNGARSAPSRPDSPISHGRSRQPAARWRFVGRPATSRRTAATRIGSPAVVARWARSPVPITDGMRKYGQPVSHWLS